MASPISAPAPASDPALARAPAPDSAPLPAPLPARFYLQEARISSLPPSAYYVPDFITAAEESALLHKINTAPLPRWKTLAHRRLQAYPSPLTPSSNTLLSAPLPGWLSDPIIPRLRSLLLSSSDEAEIETSVPSAHPSSRHIFSAAPHQAPNHVLVNEYLPGQGILPHEDGNAYYPVVVTVSLGAAVVLDVYAKGAGGTAREPQWRILQERRSLLITTGEMYTDCLHGIRGVDVDEGIGEGRLANWALVGNKEQFRDGENVRGTRVSLTFRDVVRVKSLGKAFGFARS